MNALSAAHSASPGVGGAAVSVSSAGAAVGMDNINRAKRPKRPPVVLTRTEVQAILACMDGTSAGAGL